MAKKREVKTKKPMTFKKKRRMCFFCENKVEQIDFKDLDLVRRYQSERGKILPRRQSGCCARHQRKVAQAIKKARVVGLVPYTVE